MDYQSIKDIDLVINIDSIREMPFAEVNAYLSWIAKTTKWFFSKNAMDKN